MPRSNSTINWEQERAELGGQSLADWVIAHRGEALARDLAAELSQLTHIDIHANQIHDASSRYGHPLTESERERMYTMRNVSVRRFDDPPTVEGDALVLSDLQIPYHDPDFIGRCVALAVKWHIENLVLAGDFADLQSLNSFGQRATMPLSAELKAVKALLSLLRRAFKHTLAIMGNHEVRPERMTNGQVCLRDVLADYLDKEHIEMSDYFYCLVGQKWLVTHQKNTSVIAGRVAQQLAAKHHRHVATTHEHTVASGYDVSGEYRTVAIGTCSDPAKLEYVMLRQNTRPMMKRGALIIRHDYDWHLRPDMDWRAMRSISW